jgi:hypothetical protein
MENVGVLGLLTKEDVEKMTRPALIDLVMKFNEKTQQNTILAMPERNVLQRLASHFLHNMKRPNLAKKSKSGKRPAKNLKWFNSEER